MNLGPVHLCNSILPSPISYKGDHVNTEWNHHGSSITIEGTLVIVVWWDFWRGGAYSVFGWETRGKKTLRSCAAAKTMRSWYSARYERAGAHGLRGTIIYSVTRPLQLGRPPYPHSRKHIPDTDALSRRGTLTHKSCSSTIDFFFSNEWAEPYRHPHCTTQTNTTTHT